jgi:acetoin utilization protein AcuB
MLLALQPKDRLRSSIGMYFGGGGMTPYLVRDFMTTSVTTLPDDAKLLDAVLLLRRTGKRHLPILTAEEKVAGILSDRDLRLLTPSALAPVSLEEQNRIFSETPITSAMTKNPICVLPDSTVAQAIGLMQAKKIQCVLVEEKGKLCGIFTVTDVMNVAHKLLAEWDGGNKASA